MPHPTNAVMNTSDMAKRYAYITSSALVICVTWLFVGLDRYVGDHEVGPGWTLFIKASPTWQVFFQNPAQHALDRDAFDAIDSARQTQFVAYCRVRHGTKDPHRCEEQIEAMRVK